MSVPKLRFKREDGTEYPEWEEKIISDICEPHARIGWQNLRTDEFLDEGDYYLVTGTDFLNGRVNFATCHYIDRERFEQDKNIQISNGDILITKDGTLGKVALVENMDKMGTLNAGVFVLQNLAQNIYNLYLYQYLTAPYLLNFAFDKATGGTIKHLNQNILVQFPVPLPCLEEQQKIADFLSTVDEVIAQSEAEVQNLEQQKKAAMQKIFSQEVRFKREDGTEYPEWEEKTLQDVSQYITTTGTGIKSVYVGTENMQKGCAGVCFDCDDDIAVKGIQYVPDDILISNIRPYLKKAWKADRNGICSTDVLCIRGTSEILSDFLYTVLSSDSFFEYVMQGVKGTKMPRGDKKHIMEMPVFIPCFEEQQKIADFLSAYDEAISYAKQELDKWKELKKGLLQQMFV